MLDQGGGEGGGNTKSPPNFHPDPLVCGTDIRVATHTRDARISLTQRRSTRVTRSQSGPSWNHRSRRSATDRDDSMKVLQGRRVWGGGGGLMMIMMMKVIMVITDDDDDDNDDGDEEENDDST